MNATARIATVALGAALACAGTTATAATMTFDSLPDEGAMLGSYSENGVTATALDFAALAYSGTPGALHVDDSGTGMTGHVGFATGGIFDATGFTLTSLGYNFWDSPDPLTDNIFVSGFLGGNQVATASFLLSDVAGTVQSILLGAGFRGLDRLEILLAYPVNAAMCDAPCGHFDLNDVTLAPVPLPASGLLLAGLGAGLGGGALALRRRTKAG